MSSAKELHQMTRDELSTKLSELVKENFKLKMQHGSGQLNQHHLLKQVRRDIARVKTIMHQKSNQEVSA